MANRVGSYFPSNPNQTKRIMNKHKVKHHRNSGTKNRQYRTTPEPPPSSIKSYIPSIINHVKYLFG